MKTSVVALVALLFVACLLPACAEKKESALPFKVGIVTGTVSQGEDEYRAAQDLKERYPGSVIHRTYPDNFNGVHGSHRAPPPEAGLIRGSYGPCGAARLPDPIGNVWVLPTNVGEWHILTEKGFYLTRLFQGDPMKFVWPEKAGPGAVMDNCPPGMGGEDLLYADYVYFFTTKVALCPPKPSAFDAATFILCCLGLFGT